MITSRKIRKVAIVHDWLPLFGGAERVLEQILDLFPEASLYTLIDALPKADRKFLFGRDVHTSFIQRLPFGKTHYRNFFPLMPLAIEQFNLSAFDLVVSSSYSFAKGVVTGPGQLHVCYCHSPIRYAWDLQNQYLDEGGLRKGVKSLLVRLALHYLRVWDVRTSAGVDHFLANSHYVARRIEKVYRRKAHVIYPPIECDDFRVGRVKEDFYLTASRLVPYKKIPLVVDAFRGMPNRRLVVIGDGPQRSKIDTRGISNVEFLGWQPTDVLRDHMERARAFIFPAEEDFGIMPVEAQACGTPVIAYNRGGVTETVIDGETGTFFAEQSAQCIQNAVQDFEMCEPAFSADRIRRNAERFNAVRFRSELSRFIDDAMENFSEKKF